MIVINSHVKIGQNEGFITKDGMFTINHNGTSYDITMGTNTLIFTKTDTTATNVSIALSGSEITLSCSTPAMSGTLTDEVSALDFVYYDSAGVVTASTSDVAFVEFTLTLTNPISGGDFTQRTRVALRDQS